MHRIPANKLLGRNPPLRKKILLEYMKSPSGVADIVLAEKLKIDQSDLVKQHLKALKSSHLFSWDNVPGDDSEGLLRHLVEYYGIKWAKNAEICKSEDGKTLQISKDGDSAEITIDKKGKATLKISDGDRAYELQVKEENDELNLYTFGLLCKCSVVDTRPMGRARTPTEMTLNGHCWVSDINMIHAIVRNGVFDPRDRETWGALKNLLTYHGWIPELVEHFDHSLPLFTVSSRPHRYLFSWDNVPGKDSKRLISYFNCDLNIDQESNVEIHKSDDCKTIHIRNGGRSAKIVMGEGEKMAHIKINHERFCGMNVKEENGKLNLYTYGGFNGYLAHCEVVGTVETGDDVYSVMERYHLPEAWEECIEEMLTNPPSQKLIRSRLKFTNCIARLRGFTDNLKYGDISFLIIKPYISKQEKRFLEESLKTNWLALKFVLYFLSANCGERRQIIKHIESGAGEIFKFLHDDFLRSCRIGLNWVASRTNMPPADYERMADELLDGFDPNLCTNWMAFFDHLKYFSFFRFLSD